MWWHHYPTIYVVTSLSYNICGDIIILQYMWWHHYPLSFILYPLSFILQFHSILYVVTSLSFIHYPLSIICIQYIFIVISYVPNDWIYISQDISYKSVSEVDKVGLWGHGDLTPPRIPNPIYPILSTVSLSLSIYLSHLPAKFSFLGSKNGPGFSQAGGKVGKIMERGRREEETK